MKKYILIGLISFCQIALSQTVFINEIHYDNAGADVNEGFEIFGPAGTDLSCYDIILYNGSNQQVYATINLSGLIDDEGCGYGAVWFSFSGIQNGAPDGICLYNNCTSTVVQFLSYEGSFTAANGVANGMTSTDIGVSETGSTLSTESLQLTGSGQTYGDFSWTGPTTSSMGSLNAGQDPCIGCGGLDVEPTTEATGISTPNIGCTSVTIEWTLPTTATDVLVVISAVAITDTPTDATAYTANSAFGLGDELVLTDQQYVAYDGSGTTVSITSLTPGTTYNYAIFGYNGLQANCEENYLTGGSFGSFTTDNPCSTPQISSIMYNSCNGTAEGTDELIIFEMGNDPIPVDSITIELPNSTWCNDTCGTNYIVNNQTYIDDLNAMAGCALFVYADPIPAGATVIVFTGNPPSTVLDYSSQCGAAGAPFYALFLDNSSTTGNFVNSSTSPRDLTIHFGSSYSDMVSYIADDGVGNVDGATVNFDAAGNPTYIESVGCVYPLAITLTSFSGFSHEGNSILRWSTFGESNSDHFEIQRSTDGSTFESIGEVRAAGNSDHTIDYEFIDYNVAPNENYYRLVIYDQNQNFAISQTIQVIHENASIYYFDGMIWVGFKEKPNHTYTLNIYSLSGQLMYSQWIESDVQIPWNYIGLYIVSIEELNVQKKVSGGY